jgi:hypothetical protein
MRLTSEMTAPSGRNPAPIDHGDEVRRSAQNTLCASIPHQAGRYRHRTRPPLLLTSPAKDAKLTSAPRDAAPPANLRSRVALLFSSPHPTRAASKYHRQHQDVILNTSRLTLPPRFPVTEINLAQQQTHGSNQPSGRPDWRPSPHKGQGLTRTDIRGSASSQNGHVRSTLGSLRPNHPARALRKK